MKTKSLAGKVLAVLLAVSLCALSFTACGKLEIKKADTYADEIEATGIFDSACDQALPQTIIYKLITEHFAATSKLPVKFYKKQIYAQPRRGGSLCPPVKSDETFYKTKIEFFILPIKWDILLSPKNCSGGRGDPLLQDGAQNITETKRETPEAVYASGEVLTGY